MRWVVLVITMFGGSAVASAARVSLEVPSGKLIEYQSDATAGTLLKNALSSGYTADHVEERVVTEDQWKVLKKQWIDDPAEVRRLADAEKAKQSAPVEVPLGAFGAGVAGALTALGGQGLVVLARKKTVSSETSGMPPVP